MNFAADLLLRSADQINTVSLISARFNQISTLLTKLPLVKQADTFTGVNSRRDLHRYCGARGVVI